MPLEVIYEDNHLIAVNKKSGDLVQGDKTGDAPLSDKLKDYLKEKYQKPGNVFCGVIHRLDRPVSGVVLFAKTSKALARMNEMFRGRDIQKIYWAIVKERPKKDNAVLINYLVKDEKNNRSKAVGAENKSASKAELEYKLIGKTDNYFLLEVYPLTGRHHQIRVQLSTMGSPIKGDLKYGFNRSNPDGSISLHARKLIFNHPVTKEKIEIVATPPDEVVWNACAKSVVNKV
ncbi:MAG: RluA family pseudouridine synthase [Bacteroidia bacterium]